MALMIPARASNGSVIPAKERFLEAVVKRKKGRIDNHKKPVCTIIVANGFNPAFLRSGVITAYNAAEIDVKNRPFIVLSIFVS